MEVPVSGASGFLPIRFIREVIAELKKVTWPTREETIKLTVIVIVISIIVAFYIGGLDLLFVNITTKIFTR
jgi:preprotein translocase subunit SecE